jgi:hypothetical protein
MSFGPIADTLKPAAKKYVAQYRAVTVSGVIQFCLQVLNAGGKAGRSRCRRETPAHAHCKLILENFNHSY